MVCMRGGGGSDGVYEKRWRGVTVCMHERRLGSEGVHERMWRGVMVCMRRGGRE